MKVHILLLPVLCAVLPLAGQWNAPDKNKKLANQIPGIQLVRMDQKTLLKEACLEAMKKWKKSPLTDSTFAKFAAMAPADHDLQA